QPTILLALTVVCGSPLAAQEQPTEQTPTQRTHVVRRGDTLWDLARRYLSNPFLWPKIYEANRAAIRDPHWIYPDQRFVIPPVPADAVAVGEREVQAGEPVAGVEGGMRPVALEEAAARPQTRTVFYRGGQPEPEPEPVGREIEVREREALLQVQPGESESAAWLADEDDLTVLGEVVEEVGRREGKDRLLHSMHPIDRVYVRFRNNARRPEVGERLLLVSVGRGAGRWGRVIEPTAVATVQELADEVMVVQLTRQFGPVHAGDLALPFEEGTGAPAAEVAVADGPEGEIIEFRTRQPQPGVADQAFVSLGRRDGLQVGDELVAYQPERPAGDGSAWLPEEPVATLTVVRVEERSATVRVTGMMSSALAPGLPVRLVRTTR
ncbi:MAG TPA: LysM peptidoglycan-binding domain-containing protein, partial [Longimicrobiales bacterium]